MSKDKTSGKKTISNWREILSQEDLSSDNYLYEVIQIVESNWLAVENVNNIVQCAQNSESIIAISKEDLIQFLKSEVEIGKGKGAKEANALSKSLIKSAKNDMEPENLTSESIASLVKIKILSCKEAFITQREITAKLKKQLEDELKKIAAAKAKEAKEGKGGKEDKKAKENKGKDKKDKGGKGALTLEEIYSQLHKDIDPEELKNRLKEPSLFTTNYDPPEKEITYYFLLNQIYDSQVIEQLSKLGVQVNLFIEIDSEYRKGYLDELLEEERTIDSSEGYINNFWEPWLHATTLSEVLPQNTCYVKYIPSDGLSPEENFKDFTRILMNIGDFKRHYKTYFENVRFLNVKERGKPIDINCLTTYKSLLNQVPSECITIPFILDSLLEEICVRLEKKEKIINDNPVKPQNKTHGGPTQQIKKLLNKYDCKFRKVPDEPNMPKTIKLQYGNVLEYICANIKSNIVDITLKAFKKTTPTNLFELYPNVDTTNVLFYKYLFNKWASQEVDKTVKELKQCVYAFLFHRKHYKTSDIICNKPKQSNIQLLMFGDDKPYNENTSTQPNITSNPFDGKLTSQIKDSTIIKESCLCKYYSPENCSCESPENYCTLCEELDPITLLQMLKVSQEEYKHFDYKYFAPNDALLIRFHYCVDANKIRTEKCVNSLRTVICFRDFCAFVLQEDTDWFIEKDSIYWKEIKEEEQRFKDQRQQRIMSQAVCTDDFIIPGSLKDQKRKLEDEEKLGKGGKRKSDDKKRGSKDKAPKGKGMKSSIGLAVKAITIPKRASDPYVPKSFPPHDPSRTYTYEIYNLGPNMVKSTDEVIDFHSVDGITVSIHKQRLNNQNLTYCFNISANSSNLIIHTILDNYFKSVKPFQFHVNVANGAIMVFSKPFQIEADNSKHVVTDIIEKKDPIDTIFSKSVSRSVSKGTNDFAQDDNLLLLKEAIRNQIPIFKIISSRLHKYQYVKRVKSPLIFPVGKIMRRILCKPTLFIRTKSKKSIQESKCIPYTELMNTQKTNINMEFKTTLPTGLLIQTSNAIQPYPFYVKQKYVLERKDLQGIQDESYRCFCRKGNLLKFLKDGTVKSYTPDKNISHYKYGCFSSNKRRVRQSVEQIMDSLRNKKEKDILPIHFYINNLSRLQKRIRNMCNRYKNHLIDIADNYRFESSRLECRKLHKVYKISKRLYGINSATMPLLNYNVVTSDGRQIDVKNNIVYDYEKRYRQMEYNDYLLSETIIHREDGTSWLLTMDGKAITQFPDGTRITTWFEELEEAAFEKSTTLFSETVTPSLDKYCQVDDIVSLENSVINNAEEIVGIESNSLNSEDSMSVLYTTTIRPEYENFVYLGMNYKFEHPNYATVTYLCAEEITKIKMPDNIEVTITKDGSYTVNLLNNDTINIDQNSLKFNASRCEYSECKVSCKLNIFPLTAEIDSTEHAPNFLSIKDSTNRVFEVNYSGEISNYVTKTEDDLCKNIFSHSHDRPQERYFVVNRDLSGDELYHSPVPYNFLHTLNKKNVDTKDDQIINLEEESCITLIQPLRKTYTEHLMMLYEIPILATTNERKCINTFWKLHDLNINTIILKRKPIFTFQRLINRLPVEILRTLTDMLAMTLSGGKYDIPDVKIVENLIEIEKDTPAPIITKPVAKIPLKSKTVKKLSDRYRKLIRKGEIPKYFDTLKGICFTTVEECSEGAIKVGDLSSIPSAVSKKEEKQEEAEIVEQDSIATQMVKQDINETENLPLSLNVPQQLTIHLKPESFVHDIEITSTGLRVISEKDTKNYTFPKSVTSTPKTDLGKTEIGKGDCISSKSLKNSPKVDTNQFKSSKESFKIKESSNVSNKNSGKSGSGIQNTVQISKTNKEQLKTNEKTKHDQEKREGRAAAGTDDDTITKLPAPDYTAMYSSVLPRSGNINADYISTFPNSTPQTPANSIANLHSALEDLFDDIEKKRQIKKEKTRQFRSDIGFTHKNVCKNHAPTNIKCDNETCTCSVIQPKVKSSKPEKKCSCLVGKCFCSKLLDKDSFQLYFPDDEYSDIDFKNLAWTILQYFEEKVSKFKFLVEHLDEVIETAAKSIEMPKEEANNLTKALQEEIPIYPPRKEETTLTTEEILNILQKVRETIPKKGSKKTAPLDPIELDVIASSIHQAIVENRVGSTRSEIIADLKQKISEPFLTSHQKIEVITAVSKKVIERKVSETQPKSRYSVISNLFQKIINAVDKAIEDLDKREKPCCTICGKDGGILKDKEKEDTCGNPDCKSKRKLSKPKTEINEFFTKADAVISQSFKDGKHVPKIKKRRTSTNVSLKLKIDDEFKKLHGKEEEVVKKVYKVDDAPSKQSIREEKMVKKVVEKTFARPNIYDAKFERK